MEADLLSVFGQTENFSIEREGKCLLVSVTNKLYSIVKTSMSSVATTLLSQLA